MTKFLGQLAYENKNVNKFSAIFYRITDRFRVRKHLVNYSVKSIVPITLLPGTSNLSRTITKGKHFSEVACYKSFRFVHVC